MAQQRQILNFMTDFNKEAAAALAALDNLSRAIAFYDALNLDEPEVFAPEALDGSEFEGVTREQVWVTVDTVKFVIESMRTAGVFAAVAPILSAPPSEGR